MQFYTQEWAFQHNHPQPPLLKTANDVHALKALLESCRNLFWKEFQSLAPNLAKDELLKTRIAVATVEPGGKASFLYCRM